MSEYYPAGEQAPLRPGVINSALGYELDAYALIPLAIYTTNASILLRLQQKPQKKPAIILGANNAERDKPQMFLRRLKNMGLDSQRYRTPDGFRRFFSREDLRNLQSDKSS